VRGVIAVAATVAIAACATTPRPAIPTIALAPADLGQQVSVFQRLGVAPIAQGTAAAGTGGPITVEALVEMDDRVVRVAAFVLSQRVLTLQWDGARLAVEQSGNLPPGVAGSRILRDLQLAYWPASAIRTVLPEGWALEDGARERELRYGRQVAVRVRYSDDTRWLGRIELSNFPEGYQLTIDSVPMEGEARDG
jgi:hypothetical protein